MLSQLWHPPYFNSTQALTKWIQCRSSLIGQMDPVQWKPLHTPVFHTFSYLRMIKGSGWDAICKATLSMLSSQDLRTNWIYPGIIPLSHNAWIIFLTYFYQFQRQRDWERDRNTHDERESSLTPVHLLLGTKLVNPDLWADRESNRDLPVRKFILNHWAMLAG